MISNNVWFFKKCCFTAMTFFVCSTLKCVSMNNKECKISSEMLDFNSYEPLFYPHNIKVNILATEVF